MRLGFPLTSISNQILLEAIIFAGKYYIFYVSLPATFSVAVLDRIVPTSCTEATHWYLPSSGRERREWCTEEKNREPFESRRL